MFALKWKCINIHSFSPLPLLSVYIVIDKKKKKKKPKQRKCLIAVAFVTFEQSMGVIIFIANDSCGFFMPSPSAVRHLILIPPNQPVFTVLSWPWAPSAFPFDRGKCGMCPLESGAEMRSNIYMHMNVKPLFVIESA